MRPGAGLRGIAHDLSELLGLAPRRRHREVTRLAAEVADALNERGRLRQWAGTIYAALSAENEQPPGLQALALQLERLTGDLAEAPEVWLPSWLPGCGPSPDRQSLTGDGFRE